MLVKFKKISVKFKKLKWTLKKLKKIFWKIKKIFSKFDKILLILHENCKAVMINKKCYCIFRKS